MARQTFPLTVKEGSATVKIYRTPTKIGKGRSAQAYDAFTVVWNFGGARVRKKFGDLGKAKQEAQAAAIKMANGQMETRQLSPTQLRAFESASETLIEIGSPALDKAILEYVEAKKAVKGGNLVQAAQFFSRYGADKLAPSTVPAAVTALVQSLKDAKLGDYHIQTIDSRLGKFAEAFQGDIAEVTTAQLEKWLKSLDCEPRTRNNYRAAIVQLFNFSKTKLKALPHWLPHAAEETIKVKEGVKDTEIYSTEEMTTILRLAPPPLVPLLAIRAFSGIRNEELFKLTWDQLDLPSGWIKLKRATTKLRARRVIPILPNLKEWLRDIAKSEGRVHAGYASAKTLSEAVSNAIRDSGVAVKRNALRNCYTSYRLAVLGDIARVAEETGNSPEVIREEYLELVTPEVGARWFRIFPANR
ncbi:site-specific recombinase XerC [Opitutaceae bacterium TAV1]|nr:site-specific recombinase XerC [Opitutaceae bacterium TAV1]